MNTKIKMNPKETLKDLTTLELAQVLAERMTITSSDWHQLKANRKAQAGQQLSSALVFLLKDESEEALQRLKQGSGWLDKSISPLPCPTHGDKK